MHSRDLDNDQFDLKMNVHFPVARAMSGVREGLQSFSGPSRVSLLLARKKESPLWVYDQQGLLREHREKLRDLYVADTSWRDNAPDMSGLNPFFVSRNAGGLKIPGLISFGSRDLATFYQMWFTENHPNSCSEGPTERWLQAAASALAYDLLVSEMHFPEATKLHLQGFSIKAVAHHLSSEIQKLRHRSPKPAIEHFLNALLGISTILEEGARVTGKLLYCEKDDLGELSIDAKFSDSTAPKMSQQKHVRKLLQSVENSDHYLVLCGDSVLGIASGKVPAAAVLADIKKCPRMHPPW